ncbi:MAG: MogA/MoaB family molybdenum cofactor biosynthesis protein [bacterium]
MYTVAIITISDKGSAGEREDRSGPLLQKMLPADTFSVSLYKIIPDDFQEIKRCLEECCDQKKVNLVLTSGGTGLSPRDVTPEATRAVIEKDAPGFSEAIRIQGISSTPFSILSRAISGIRGKTLVINLPGSPKGAQEGLSIILPTLSHALAKLLGDPAECGGQ